jgi:GntR family transcriptional regulator
MPKTSDPTPVRLPAARYADATAELGPWEIACAQQGLDGHTVVTDVSERPADETTAAALGIESGSTAIHRANQMFVGDQIAQLQDTWLPLSLVTGTALAASEKAVGGIYRGLSDIGHPLPLRTKK